MRNKSSEPQNYTLSVIKQDRNCTNNSREMPLNERGHMINHGKWSTLNPIFTVKTARPARGPPNISFKCSTIESSQDTIRGYKSAGYQNKLLHLGVVASKIDIADFGTRLMTKQSPSQPLGPESRKVDGERVTPDRAAAKDTNG